MLADGTGVLNDATKCVGCKACVVACKENASLPADTRASKLYDGSLSALGSLGLGTFAASGGSHTYYFHIDLPSTGTDAGDNAFQGLSATESLTWSATQA